MVSADALTRKLEPPPPSRTDPVELGDGVVELLRLLRIRLAFGLELRDLQLSDLDDLFLLPGIIDKQLAPGGLGHQETAMAPHT